MEISEELKKTVGKALGRVPSGVYIVTAGKGADATGMMASWVQQASFRPPCLSVAVAKGRPIADLIRKTGIFAVNVLGEGDHGLMKKFARGIGTGESAFDGVKVRLGSDGILLLDEALAVMECRLRQICEFGADHELLIAEVRHGGVVREGEPLKHVRGHGFHY